MKNKLLIAAAGAGKTTYLFEKAHQISDSNVHITTYTEANEDEIRKKFIENGGVPNNVTIQTWYALLLQHGVRPYQSMMDEFLHRKRIGFYLNTGKSGFRYKNGKGFPVYWGEKDVLKYYLTKDYKIYADKTSKFVYEIDEKMKNRGAKYGEIMERLARIYPNIFVDEVQDLAGYDLEILKKLISTTTNVIMVGDPRQVTYLTHQPSKNKQFKDGKILEYIEQNCKEEVEIDEVTLNNSHRNNEAICDYSSKLFPDYKKVKACTCDKCRNYIEADEGIYLLDEKDIENYKSLYEDVIVLRSKNAAQPEWNFGRSKGKTFNRVLIYPTEDMRKWIINHNVKLAFTTRSKFYVALTRARYSVAIVFKDLEDLRIPKDIEVWKYQKTT